MPRLMRALRIGGVDAVHVVALFVGDHFERQLVVVAQEQGPLAVVRNRRRLLEDVDDRKAILHVHRHEHARHDREVKGHVAFVAVAEIGDRVFRPLVGLGQQHAIADSFWSMWRRSSFKNSRASPAGSRSSCLRARRDTAPRRAASRRRPCRARNRRLRKSPGGPRDCRSSDRADGNRSGASSRLWRPGPRSSWTSRSP